VLLYHWIDAMKKSLRQERQERQGRDLLYLAAGKSFKRFRIPLALSASWRFAWGSETVNQSLADATQSVPPGAWAIGVSGGADSIALLTLLAPRSDLSLHVVHLNHETRGQESDGDADFVIQLATSLGLPSSIERRSAMERSLSDLPRNPSARYRRMRIGLFQRVARDHCLNGVLLAHHADDQAETVLHRLLRGSGARGLAGMSADSRMGGLRCLRPLLGIRRETVRQWLRDGDQPWREDSSNRSPKYMRNRLRALLEVNSGLSDALLELAGASSALRNWLRSTSLPAEPALKLRTIADLPILLARASARNWLIAQGVEPGKVELQTVEQLLRMCLDASTLPRMQFPNGVMVARRKGIIEKVNSESRASNSPSAPQQPDRSNPAL
jgi:tRNA(Ile)-lysidine synthetase-like protein